MSVDALKLKRSQIKGRVTRLRNYIDAVDTDNLNHDTINQLKSRLEKFENPTWEEFENIQSQLEILSPAESDNQERYAFEKDYFNLVSEIKSICDNFNQNSNSVIHGYNSLSNNNFDSIRVKLPAIKLTTFDGQYGNWLEFKDSFNALVESNVSLSDIQKFYYLRASLEMEPAAIIKSIDVSSENYKIAWQLLQDRYENKELIIHNHIHGIFELPTIKKECHTELRNLLDNINKHLRSLHALGENTDSWGRLIIYILTTKFDNVTRRDWESYKCKNKLRDMHDMNNFLKSKCDLLEKMEMTKQDTNKNLSRQRGYSNAFVSTNKGVNCVFCNKAHSIYECKTFLDLPVEQRISEVKRLKVCLNCFRRNHFSTNCQSRKCRQCGKCHNSLLHLNFKNNPNHTVTTTPQISEGLGESSVSTNEPQVVVSNHSLNNKEASNQVLLSTAIVKLINNKNEVYYCRVLLDNGSQSNFITEQVCNKLNLETSDINYTVKGVGKALSHINRQVKIKIASCINNFEFSIHCLVLPVITDKIPAKSFDKSLLNIPNYLKLADTNFNVAAKVDLLIGSGLFWSIICEGKINIGLNMPILQNTLLGWIVGGECNINDKNLNSITCTAVDVKQSKNNNFCSTDELIKKFWEVEEINDQRSKLPLNDYCESYFKKTVKRNLIGQFVVSIPFNNLINSLGSSKQIAVNRFKSLERKFASNPSFKSDYVKFMNEYERLGHMSKIKFSNENKFEYYIPHHAVIKDSSSTTKLRVVFDASAKSNSGISLNDAQYKGPTIQNDILSIILRFRTHTFVLTADISKMYRQILINEEHRNFQKILWRENPNSELQCYKLNTVTYGTSSAPYLAVRCLYQVAIENEEKFPIESHIIKNDFYVDDLITGSNSLENLITLQKTLVIYYQMRVLSYASGLVIT